VRVTTHTDRPPEGPVSSLKSIGYHDISMRRRSVIAGLPALAGGCLGNRAGPVSKPGTRTPFAAGRNEPRSGADFPRPDDPVPDRVGTEIVTDEVSRPVEMTFLPDGSAYVVERTGSVYRLTDDGLSSAPVLDLTDRLLEFDPTRKYEVGLLGIELHPNFASNDRLFVRYSSPPRPGTPADDYHHTFVLSEFAASTDRETIRKGSERTVMEIPQPEAFHQSGDIIFGPDDYLYVATGDSGQPGDGSVEHPGYVDDWYEVNWGGNGQNTSDTLLAGILRLDVDAEPTRHYRTDDDAPGEPDGLGGYAVPPDNPLTDWDGHRDEYFAWGFRNPWKTTFHEGAYIAADVGETGWESVYYVQKGGNYGWDVREGSHCYYVNEAPENPSACPDSTPDDVRGGEPLLDPVIEYPWWGDPPADRLAGEAVIGGHVYLGSAIPGLYGRYVFGDITANERFFVATPPEGPLDQPWETELVRTEDIEPYRSFSRDADGELYVLTKNAVRKMVPAVDRIASPSGAR
jgi:glucose/arabinose dehydrogenase